jgi:hypothetical protein
MEQLRGRPRSTAPASIIRITWGLLCRTARPHGTDANLNATYVIPFLDLDETGADPQVAACCSG